MSDTEEHTGVGVFLIPEAGDPIVAASSEPAHLTTVWLGDMNDLEPDTIAAILDEVQAYADTLEGPVVVPTSRRGELGDEGADVVFLEATDALIALRDGLLAASPTVQAVMDSVEQFPEWTPHVTLGYPETPAAGEYEGDAVSFDRVGVWVGPDQHDFVMGGEMSEKIEAAATPGGFVLEYDHRSDNGDVRIGPFSSVEEAEAYATELQRKATEEGGSWDAVYSVFDLAAVVGDADAELDAAEMPLDELEEGEEEVTEIPVHGIATIEGRPTGDGRGFRRGALQIGALPQPLGYEFEHGHGSDNSRVAIVGRIDEFFRHEGDEYDEIRWRGVILTTKEYAAQAVESIVDGSYTGVSVIVDDVELDVEEQREELRERLELEQKADEGEGPSELDIDELVDLMIGDGKQEVTWFSAARVRRFDMVPTGAYQEAYIGLGHEFTDELTPDRIEASVQALADCGCLSEAEIIDISSLSDEELAAYEALSPEEQDVYATDHGLFISATEALAASASFAPGTKDGPGWITHPIPTARIRRYWVRGKGAAKIRWGIPGDFNRCRAQLAKYVQNPEWLAGLCANMHKEAIGVWPGQEHAAAPLVASAAPLFSLVAAVEPVDADFFRNPQLTKPTGVTVDGDRIYGHLASWNVCHIGEPEGPGRCTLAPRSNTEYAHFRTGTVMTTEGPVAVGAITMNTGHAGGRRNARATVAHYDDTGTVAADVAVGEDAHGIWFSGRIRPSLSDEDRYALAASGRLSGDWRNIGGSYELVAALVVNVPGFPIPRTSLAASADGALSLVAAGVVDLPAESTPRLEAAAVVEAVEFDIEAIALATAEQVRRLQKRDEQLERARKSAVAHSLAHARERLSRNRKV